MGVAFAPFFEDFFALLEVAASVSVVDSKSPAEDGSPFVKGATEVVSRAAGKKSPAKDGSTFIKGAAEMVALLGAVVGKSPAEDGSPFVKGAAEMVALLGAAVGKSPAEDGSTCDKGADIMASVPWALPFFSLFEDFFATAFVGGISAFAFTRGGTLGADSGRVSAS